MRRNVIGRILPIVLIAVWQLLVDTGVLDFQFLPAPDAVWRAFLQVAGSGELAKDLVHTVTVTVLAAGIALTIGGALGLAIGLLPMLRDNVMASIDYLRTIPAVALMPIALLAFGAIPSTELILAVWAAQWPILLNTAAAVRAVHQRLYDVGRTLQFSAAATVRKIVIPAVVPGWLVGARLATIIALHVTITAEMVMAPEGLGGSLVESLAALNVERMWAYAVVCGIVGALLNAALRRLIRLALPGSPVNRVEAGAP